MDTHYWYSNQLAPRELEKRICEDFEANIRKYLAPAGFIILKQGHFVYVQHPLGGCIIDITYWYIDFGNQVVKYIMSTRWGMVNMFKYLVEDYQNILDVVNTLPQPLAEEIGPEVTIFHSLMDEIEICCRQV